MTIELSLKADAVTTDQPAVPVDGVRGPNKYTVLPAAAESPITVALDLSSGMRVLRVLTPAADPSQPQRQEVLLLVGTPTQVGNLLQGRDVEIVGADRAPSEELEAERRRREKAEASLGKYKQLYGLLRDALASAGRVQQEVLAIEDAWKASQ